MKSMNTENTNANYSNKSGNTAPEFEYLEKLIRHRLNKYFPSEDDHLEPVIPDLNNWQPSLAKFIRENSLNVYEAIAILIALAPHIRPELFDSAIESKIKSTGDFPKIGGVRGKNFRGFMPTGETVLFLLADNSAVIKKEVQKLFWSTHLFGIKKVLWLEEMQTGEPAMSGRIIMSPDYIDTFTYGKPVPPHFSMSFPAKLIQTELTWDDLVIEKELQLQIKDILDWLKFNDQLMQDWGMKDRLKKGYRTLFYGPPGTGKTFTASLLGKYVGRSVYKIDLSMVVSKYIGETEKNLELLFVRAEDKGWILFFDEADALFGKRTNVRDAHDKYANQEVSYLLQRIEDYNGLVILATNMKNNIDEAFIRRFNSILKFPFPDQNQRALIWKKSLPKEVLCRKNRIAVKLSSMPEEPVDIPESVKKYELTGGNVINIVHYASIKAVEALHESKQENKKEFAIRQGIVSPSSDYSEVEVCKENGKQFTIYLSDVLDGIKRELIKEGKPFTALET
jgi:AAA+ superfamily predicted ATPase